MNNNKANNILNDVTYQELIVLKIINDNIKIDEDIRKRIDEIIVQELDTKKLSLLSMA